MTTQSETHPLGRASAAPTPTRLCEPFPANGRKIDTMPLTTGERHDLLRCHAGTSRATSALEPRFNKCFSSKYFSTASGSTARLVPARCSEDQRPEVGSRACRRALPASNLFRILLNNALYVCTAVARRFPPPFACVPTSARVNCTLRSTCVRFLSAPFLPHWHPP